MATPEDIESDDEPLLKHGRSGVFGTGDDLYVTDAPLDDRPLPSTADPRTTSRIEADLEAGRVMDPLDMLDRAAVQLLWAREGLRLLAREEAVAAEAAAHQWAFTVLDPQLSARLADNDITAGSPRVARNLCVPSTQDAASVVDLTGVTVRRDGGRPAGLRLRTGTAGLVGFSSVHHLAVVPAGAQASTWGRFGDGVCTESADFDDRFRVHAQDPRWALTVLNPALMERLLEHHPLTLVIAGDLLTVIRPGWVPTIALSDFQRFTEHLAMSAQGATSAHRQMHPPDSTARLSGWSAWPPQAP